MKIIGITGGIGSGKSTIARLLQLLGYPVYNSDERAREMYFEPEVRTAVVALLGKEVYNADGSINKKLIGTKIFSDTVLLAELNKIIHPAVMKDFTNWKDRYSDKDFVFKESALLFETGLYMNCFKNILVTAPANVRIKRVMQRDHLTFEEVQKKLDAQWPDEKKKQLADFVIDNGEEKLVVPPLLAWLQELKQTA